jgi:hypothetical protein
MIGVYIGIAALWSAICVWLGYQWAIPRAYDRGFAHARRALTRSVLAVSDKEATPVRARLHIYRCERGHSHTSTQQVAKQQCQTCFRPAIRRTDVD